MNANPWPAEEAWSWYERQPWLCGFNYVPSHAINYTEMWMDDGFDPALIDRELALAQDIGFNCARVVLPFVVWEREPQAFKSRFARFMEICHARGIRVIPALFDDCCFGTLADPVFGPQPRMIPGWYGNGWSPSPGHAIVRDPKAWPRLEPYVKDLIGAFRDDPRLLLWDLYNEPTNGVCIGKLSFPVGEVTLPLVENVFRWARGIDPAQPLTLGVWNNNPKLDDMAFRLSDVNSFHSYDAPEGLKKRIQQLNERGRPVICTEWMCRGNGSTVAACLPVFRAERIGAMHWGLVNGRTQTHLNWGHLPGDPDPAVWQHDLFRPDFTAYDPGEIALFKLTIALAADERK